jgi:Na/Pi-cotransporter
MGSINWLEVLSGFGVFLFSLRLLHSVLERPLARRLRPLLNHLLATTFQCLGIGFLSTAFLQASSITIIATMGLLNSSLITLEQGFLMMLGAAVGTTIKVWIFAENIRNYALILISLSSIALMTSRGPLIRDFWEILLAIGMAFFGFNMMVMELLPLSENQHFIQLLRLYDGTTLGSQMLGVLTGCLIAIAVQSSSTSILLTLALASEGVISIAAGATLILGANIGTTSTALMVSLEYGSNARRLAVAHFLVKAIGVGVTLLVFPYFLSTVDILVPGSAQLNIDYHLAGVHTLFNLFNLFVWVSFLNLMLRFLHWLIPSENEKNPTLPAIVRRLIVSNPEITFQEVEIQRNHAETLTKKLTDYCFEILITGLTAKKTHHSLTGILRKDFENIKECLSELLLKVSRHPLPEDKVSYVKDQLKILTECSDFYYRTLALCSHLERGLWTDGYTFPTELQPHWESLQKHLNELWLIVFLKKPGEYDATAIQAVLDSLETSYFTFLQQAGNVNYEYLAWVYETLIYLRQMVAHLSGLSKGRK